MHLSLWVHTSHRSCTAGSSRACVVWDSRGLNALQGTGGCSEIFLRNVTHLGLFEFLKRGKKMEMCCLGTTCEEPCSCSCVPQDTILCLQVWGRHTENKFGSLAQESHQTPQNPISKQAGEQQPQLGEFSTSLLLVNQKSVTEPCRTAKPCTACISTDFFLIGWCY